MSSTDLAFSIFLLINIRNRKIIFNCFHFILISLSRHFAAIFLNENCALRNGFMCIQGGERKILLLTIATSTNDNIVIIVDCANNALQTTWLKHATKNAQNCTTTDSYRNYIFFSLSLFHSQFSSVSRLWKWTFQMVQEKRRKKKFFHQKTTNSPEWYWIDSQHSVRIFFCSFWLFNFFRHCAIETFSSAREEKNT